jgi:hypothetical protein
MRFLNAVTGPRLSFVLRTEALADAAKNATGRIRQQMAAFAATTATNGPAGTGRNLNQADWQYYS